MIQKDSVFNCDFRVRSYEVDFSGKATISSVTNYFQEAAGIHANRLGIDIADLQKKGLTWILFKLQLSVNRYPERWEDVTVRTWTSLQGNLRAYRDYQLLDSGGAVLASGLSHWMMLDRESRSPVKIPDRFRKLPLKDDERAMKPHKGKVKLVPLDSSSRIATVGPTDTDLNGHANNERYIYWVSNRERTGGEEGMKCFGLTIQYMQEAVPGDSIFISEKFGERTHTSTLYKNGSESAIASAETIWKPAFSQ